jgi:enoyl-CoA hydratase/carnithine racemase
MPGAGGTQRLLRAAGRYKTLLWSLTGEMISAREAYAANLVSELVPKGLALQYPTETALATVLPMQASLRVFRPIIAALNGTATVLLRLLGSRVKSHRHLHSPEEIELLIAESRDGGLLEADEHRRLRRALRLSRRSARDLMVPRDRLSMLSADTTWDVAVATSPRVRSAGCRSIATHPIASWAHCVRRISSSVTSLRTGAARAADSPDRADCRDAAGGSHREPAA